MTQPLLGQRVAFLVAPEGPSKSNSPSRGRRCARLGPSPSWYRLMRAPVAAICHAPWVMIEADVVRDKRMTSWPSLRTDLRNAGAEWVDEAVVVDQGLVISRRPDDLPVLGARLIEEFVEGGHAAQASSA